MLPSKNKIIPLPRLLVLRRLWKRQAKTVVFTNGVFDILHTGHLGILERARGLGDILIVGINSDASARRLGKSKDRPINRLVDRTAILAGLSAVDAVIAFGEDTPEKLLSKLKPDVLVKGADYRKGEIAGAAHAGRVARLALKKGYSTTALIRRLQGKS